MVNEAKQLPDDWIWKTIGEVTLPIEKVDPKQKPRKEFTYLDIASIDNSLHKITEPKSYYGGDAPSRARQLVQAHDVLFSTVRTYLENIAQVPEIYDGQIASTGFSVLRSNESVLPKYLFYYSLTQQFLEPLNELQRGTSYPAVRDSDVRVQKIPVAPLPEQERIVAKIEELFTQLEAGTSALERVQAGLRRYKASVLKAAVEGKLIGNGKVENGELPEGWRRTTWKEISPRVTVGYVGKMKNEYTENGIPFLRGQNVREMRFEPAGLLHISPEFHKRISKSTLNPGDIVVVRSGSVGVSCVIPDTLEEANCSDLVIIKRPKEMIPEFGAYYLNSLAKSYVREKQVGVALTHFNTKSVADMPVPLPPLEEQRGIVAEVERRLSVARQVENSVEEALVRASRLRQAVLRSAFEGRL